MRPRSVVLLHNRSLLAAGVQGLLKEREGIALTIVPADDPEFAVKLKRAKPWAVVLDSGDSSLGYGAIAQILRECPKAKVISLSVGNTSLDVYRVRHVLETSLDGLLEAVQGGRGLARKATVSGPGQIGRVEGGETKS